MDREEFWTTDDDEAVLAEYLAQHSFGMSMAGGDLVLSFGDPDRLPYPEELTPAEPEAADCAVCRTEVRCYPQAGWRHVVGMSERGGCTTPWPLATS